MGVAVRLPVRLFARVQRDERGAIAIIFALTLVALAGAVGLGVDYGRSFSVATKLRNAADAAALAGAKLIDEGVSNSHIQTVSQAYFQAQIDSLGVGYVTASPLVVNIDRANSAVDVTSNISVATTFSNVVQVPSLDFSVASKAIYQIKKVELAMVLDVTGSMNNNGRLDALKSAAGNIIDTLVNNASGKHNRVALVPYSAAVNVGSAYATTASGGDSADGCVMERLQAPHRDDDYVSEFPNNYAVNGQLNSSTTGRYLCPNAELAPLSKNAGDLKATINSYAASGWTAGHIGLAWGWNTLSPKWAGVFTGVAAPGNYNDPKVIKAVILMTDGEFNTSYSGGATQEGQKSESRTRTLALCDNMKAENIRIFTVAFEAPIEAETLLQSCASSSSNHFNAANSVELNSAFQAIADNLRTMRLSE